MNVDKLSTRCMTETCTHQVSTAPSQTEMSPKLMAYDSISGISTHRSRRLFSNSNKQEQLRSLHCKFTACSLITFIIAKNDSNNITMTQ